MQADSSSYQAQISRDESGFNACGIRAVSIVGDPKTNTVYDFSLNVRLPGFGLVKVGKSTIKTSDMLAKNGKQKISLPAPIRFWISKSDSGKAATPTKYVPAETAGFVLGGMDFVESAEIIYAMAYGEQVQFSVSYKGDNLQSIVGISSQLSDIDKKSLNACFKGLADRIQAEGVEEKK
ncbi:hypothetical protein [Herbaspirillum sp. alder98]|uniref:hypothetical protein n=1 Tax=Herbaspirillum sp. alder98 TaxID=2913096 RepID=UPI001CD8412B|nr:hypothetical protein [Herbaspirillum sp. alder98]